MLKVYIASPYTKGDVAVNVKQQIDTASELITLGYAPFTPLLSHFLHMAHPAPYEVWTALDLEWLPFCDIFLRLPGESAGADKEEDCAGELDMPIVYSIEELERHYA